MVMQSSQAAVDLIISEETGGKEYYAKTEQSTDWPGGMSGVTIGCGYDLGYSSAEEIGRVWGPKLPAIMVSRLQSCAGVRGRAARALAAELKSKVNVPWDVAIQVFIENDIPKWESIVRHNLLNTDLLSGDCFGALLSIVFNRGASFNLLGDRYKEMRAIRAYMATSEFAKIPEQIRSMKRLWPSGGDLYNRREHEAKLFEQGLNDATPQA